MVFYTLLLPIKKKKNCAIFFPEARFVRCSFFINLLNGKATEFKLMGLMEV